jgi:methionine-rich copper-binding protein CopC
MLRVLALGLLAGTVAATAADRHMSLTKSHPAADTTVTESPSTVQAWYSQQPELAVSRLSLRFEGGAVELGATRSGPGNSLVASVEQALAPGRYTASWRTAGDDGHVVRGTFDFAVVSAPPNTR